MPVDPRGATAEVSVVCVVPGLAGGGWGFLTGCCRGVLVSLLDGGQRCEVGALRAGSAP